MKRIDKVYRCLKELCQRQFAERGEVIGVSATEIAQALGIQRTNASSDLNALYREGKVEKVEGKPVLYKVKEIDLVVSGSIGIERDSFDAIIGANLSLKNAVQQAKAAIIYPPSGLHTLLLGETGTGKSMFAEVMYNFAKEVGRIKSSAPFIVFNCADYANNPQLLMAQLFGVKKGAYTGADRDRAGLVEKADGGILFLDEVHRLPPEGQEMLFYLMDKGLYRRLGETESQHKAQVLIICATTESIESALLKTFIRRIPMIIKLPNLSERTVEERFELVKSFFKAEAAVVKADISITSNALKALLLYECPGNIGQLKSDIKLSIAKAYLGYMMKRDDKLCVHTEDLPDYVRKGLLKYRELKDEIDKFVTGEIVKFSSLAFSPVVQQEKQIFNLYEALEEKRRALEEKGLSESDIKLIMSIDIETYLKKFMKNLANDDLEELYKVVDKRVVDIVREFLDYASRELGRFFADKTLYGLSMHVASSIERIKSGKEIVNHQLENIRKVYEKEYEVANFLREKIEEEFAIKVPEDEVGFVAMFLCLEEEEAEKDERVGVVVAMHGEAAATSIADVSNRLLDEDIVVGYNMPLDQKPEVALDNLTNIVRKVNRGRGVLLLVDMGSLVLFGDMIYERTGIPVKTVEMVSTPMVLEAARKAIMRASLEEVYDAVVNLSPYVGRIYRDSVDYGRDIGKNVIVTACITGEGTAVKLKTILEKEFGLKEKGIDVIPLKIENKKDFKNKLDRIKNERNILAVVSALDPEDGSLVYISTSQIFDKNFKNKLQQKLEILDYFEAIDNMAQVVDENLDINSKVYISSFRKFFMRLISAGALLNKDVMIGLVIHIACVIERILKGKELPLIMNFDEIINCNREKFDLVKKSIAAFEKDFNIKIPDQECVMIMKLVFSL
ncbi:sigma 54 modulation protein [Caldanaerovirga acetigignens]|uniref:Sigma 54 modulation protein n=1 Tax=Caldanaerovirga acetigignens TaxID=447595 RepID=A0A1M7L279_9FIRM|nr:sigma-54-dependent transcriptional regulator [Caldanaerovirga acetigignens]SHM72014.1 sigma 54 modulation protein [Caldanaerovirga acetigignens]